MWSEENVARLRELWAEGLSGTQIARVLGARSRRAVLGKVHRLNLTRRVVATTAYLRVMEAFSDRGSKPAPYHPGRDPRPSWLEWRRAA